MTSFWRTLKQRAAPESYKLARLIDTREREDTKAESGACLICDIDKTYLETEFESLVRMIRIAFEAATEKVTVAGASEVLLAARWGGAKDSKLPPRPLHFVSSSPPQLRPVLEEKLMLDGLDWSSDTFKDQAYNLRMRRMDLLRQHVAYKSLAILNVTLRSAPDARFYLIGDNAESDAYIYTGVKLFLARRLSREAFAHGWLEAAGVEAQVATDLLSLVPEARGQEVAAVLIRNVPGYSFIAEPPLTDCVQPFDNFYQAALLLATHGLIAPEDLWQLTRSFHNHHGMQQRTLSATLGAVRALGQASPALKAAVAEAMAHLMPHTESDTPQGFAASLAKATDQLDRLSEGEIVQHARLWMDRIRREKEGR